MRPTLLPKPFSVWTVAVFSLFYKEGIKAYLEIMFLLGKCYFYWSVKDHRRQSVQTQRQGRRRTPPFQLLARSPSCTERAEWARARPSPLVRPSGPSISALLPAPPMGFPYILSSGTTPLHLPREQPGLSSQLLPWSALLNKLA